MAARNEEGLERTVLTGFAYIAVTFLIILVALALLYFRPTITVNNYVSAGNYSFDVGPNIARYMDKVTDNAIAQQQSVNATCVNFSITEYRSPPTPSKYSPLPPSKAIIGANGMPQTLWDVNNTLIHPDITWNTLGNSKGFWLPEQMIMFNTKCYTQTKCPCAINTSTPCMAICYKWIGTDDGRC